MNIHLLICQKESKEPLVRKHVLAKWLAGVHLSDPTDCWSKSSHGCTPGSPRTATTFRAAQFPCGWWQRCRPS